MSIARQYGLNTDYQTLMKRVNNATDKEISAVVDRPDAKDAEIARLTALVAGLTFELAELRTRTQPVRTTVVDTGIDVRNVRKAKEAERQRKRRAAAKGI